MTVSTPTTLTSVSIPDDQRSVLRAADTLFTEHSIATVTLDAVADRAGVPRDHVFRAFSTVRDLLIAVLAHKHQEWMQRLDENSVRFGDPRDEILDVFSYLEECFTDATWRGCCFVSAYTEIGREDTGIGALALEHFQEVERQMAALCLKAEVPLYVSQALTILIQGARLESGTHRGAGPARTARIAAAMLMSVYRDDPDDPAFS